MTDSVSTGLARRLVTNTLHAATGRLAGVLVWVLLTPPILRALGPEGFAIWSLYFAMTGYLAALDLGLVQSTLRHVAAARERGDQHEAGAYATIGAAGFVILGLTWLLAVSVLQGPVLGWLQVSGSALREARFALYMGAVTFTLGGVCNVALAVAQAYGRFDRANQVLLVVTAIQAAGMLVALRLGLGLHGLVASVALGWGTGAALAVLVLRRAAPDFHWRTPREARTFVSGALAFGGSMQLASILSTLHLHLDKLLLPRFVSLAAVTPYELGARVAMAASTFPNLLLLATLPEVAALHAASDDARLRELYRRTNRYVLSAGAMLLAAMLGVADPLYAAWLGPGNEISAGVLRVLAIGFAVALTTGMGTSFARGIGRPDLEASFAAVVLGTHLACSLWLVPRHGLAGALVAWLVSNAAGACVFLWSLGGALHWPRTQQLFAPLAVPTLAAAVGAGASWSLERLWVSQQGAWAWFEVIVLGALAMGVAGAFALATRYLDRRELWALVALRSRGVGEVR